MPMRSRSRNEVSLFPFLSILSCVIGTLTLIIAGLVFSQIGDPWEERANEYVRLTSERDRTTRRIDSLESLTAQATSLAETLQVARDERDLAALDATGLPGARAALDQAEEELRTARRRETRAQWPQPDRAQFQLAIRGTSQSLRPRIVECASTGLVLDPDRPGSQRRVPTRRIRSDASLRRLLSEVEADPARIVLLLVRPTPDAVDVFYDVDQVVRAGAVRYGYAALPTLGVIDYTKISEQRDPSGGGGDDR